MKSAILFLSMIVGCVFYFYFRKKGTQARETQALLARFLAGVLAQDHHERDLTARRAQEPYAIRLVPQIPIRDGQDHHSWLGGAPEMPASVEWPIINGNKAIFLVQICCAELPKGMWHGAGPREGWLLLFAGTMSLEMRVLHVPQRGPAREGPDVGKGFSWYGQPTDAVDSDRHSFPRWPVDVVTVLKGEDDPFDPNAPRAYLNDGETGFDLAAPEHMPHNWPTALAMTDMLEEDLARAVAELPKTLASIEMQIQRVAARLAEPQQPPLTPEQRASYANQAQDLPNVLRAYKDIGATMENALPLVRGIAGEMRERARTAAFSVVEIARFLTRLRDIQWMSVSRAEDKSRGSGAEINRCKSLPATVHDPEVILWAFSPRWIGDFESARMNWVKMAYTSNAGGLPEPVKRHFEDIARVDARREMPSMGHVPTRFVHEFDAENEVALIEFPSSYLMNWKFGDVDNLVVTIATKDLDAGRYDRIKAQITN